MTSTTRHIDATPDEVWEVLTDGWLYPLWVVGASRMRMVDDGFPAVGTRLHHSVGSWPVLIDDTTEVLASDPGRRLLLKARAWPAGTADVELVLHRDGDGTLVEMNEASSAGPARLVPKPLEAAGLRWRNVESLRRLAFVVEGRER